MNARPFAVVVAWALLAVLNILGTYEIWSLTTSPSSALLFNRKAIDVDYTYVDDDYPFHFPLPSGPLEDVAMTLYDSVHFGLSSTQNASNETLESLAEWHLLGSIPTSFGRVRLGPEHRMFVVAMVHQTHCLQRFQPWLMGVVEPEEEYWHMTHCLNLMRRWFLCQADASLEEGDFLDGVSSEEDLELLSFDERVERQSGNGSVGPGHGAWNPGRIRGELVCKDWQTLYEDFESNDKEWKEWASKWN